MSSRRRRGEPRPAPPWSRPAGAARPSRPVTVAAWTSARTDDEATAGDPGPLPHGRQRPWRSCETELREHLAATAPLRRAVPPATPSSRAASRARAATTGPRMSLSGYVLAARLEQVAAAPASGCPGCPRAATSWCTRDDAGPGRARGRPARCGSLDAWTGVERDTGVPVRRRAFAASLSLALGLADVVTGRGRRHPAGDPVRRRGLRHLDEDTLDEVMGVLDGLRDGGRTVGL